MNISDRMSILYALKRHGRRTVRELAEEVGPHSNQDLVHQMLDGMIASKQVQRIDLPLPHHQFAARVTYKLHPEYADGLVFDEMPARNP